MEKYQIVTLAALILVIITAFLHYSCMPLTIQFPD